MARRSHTTSVMDSYRRSKLALPALTALLFGCQPPSASTDVTTTAQGDALVLEGTTDEEQHWYGNVTVKDAPAGEYLLFQARARPTSLAGLAGLDLSTCSYANPCDVPNLGRLDERVQLDEPGPVRLRGGTDYGEDSPGHYFVFVRRGPGAKLGPTTVSATVTIEGNPGCGGSNPDPPNVATSALDGAPPFVASRTADAAADDAAPAP